MAPHLRSLWPNIGVEPRMQALPGRAPLMGLPWALPQVVGRFGAQPYVVVRRAFPQHHHGRQVAHAVGHEMLLLVAGEPVQRQAEAWLVVRPPPVLVVYPSGDSSLLLQPLLQVRKG